MKSYRYIIQRVNCVNGREMGEPAEYDSATRLKPGNLYLHLPDTPGGAYKVLKQL